MTGCILAASVRRPSDGHRRRRPRGWPGHTQEGTLRHPYGLCPSSGWRVIQKPYRSNDQTGWYIPEISWESGPRGAICSGDVYRAYGRLAGLEPGATGASGDHERAARPGSADANRLSGLCPGNSACLYRMGRAPVIRISTSLLALCCQSGLVATLATPIRARSRSIGSRSFRMSPFSIARFTSARIASQIRA